MLQTSLHFVPKPVLKKIALLGAIATLQFSLGCTSTDVSPQAAETPNGTVTVAVDQTLAELLKTADRDHDNKITIHDGGNLSYTLVDEKTLKKYPIEGAYSLSVLLQELTLAKERGQASYSLRMTKLYQDPTIRTSLMIREIFWDGLTRRLDLNGVPNMLDSKSQTNNTIYLYTPSDDPKALAYYSNVAKTLKMNGIQVEAHSLPLKVDAAFVRQLDGKHGVLTLDLELDGNAHVVGAKPFVVPGGRFNEMYGWDSFFIILGLLSDGKTSLAQSIIDNLVYEIQHYGKILNANRTYYLTRSQPPFTTSAILAVYQQLDKTPATKQWLKKSLKAAYREYENVWMKPPHFMPSYGLSRYFDEGTGPCPEVEPGHYNDVLTPYVGRQPFADSKTPEDLYKKLTAAYDANPKFRYPDKHLEDFFIQDRAERESGHDTTYRFDNRAIDFLTVDLNSLLYKTEMDFIALMDQGVIPKVGDFGSLAQWKTRAQFRKKQMLELMYDDKTGMFYDFDMKSLKHSDYISATTFYPLWAHLVDKGMAEKIARGALANLLQPGGLSATARVSLEKHGHKAGERQWEYPYGWAPHQILAWQGLRNYGFINEAHDLMNRWVTMISDGARDYNGTVPEKYDVVTRSHAVFAEYGNVGTKFNYITREGFGWMNASFELGRMYEARDKAAEKSAQRPSGTQSPTLPAKNASPTSH